MELNWKVAVTPLTTAGATTMAKERREDLAQPSSDSESSSDRPRQDGRKKPTGRKFRFLVERGDEIPFNDEYPHYNFAHEAGCF